MRGACLDMESDVTYAKKELEKIALIRDAQKEWEYILNFSYNILMFICLNATLELVIQK